MGRETRYIKIPCNVSRHNSEQDRLDDAAVDRLKAAIASLIEDDSEYSRVARLGVEESGR